MQAKNPILAATLAAGLAALAPAQAKVSADEAAKLGKELTPVGAIRAGNADGSIPEWDEGKIFTQEQKDMSYDDLVELRKKDPKEIRALFEGQLGDDLLKPQFEITQENYTQYADKLTEGHKALFKRYPTYKMKVYKSFRPAFFPQEIYDATIKNATTATMVGSDDFDNATVGFPFPIPQTGPEPLFNHRLKYRGRAAQRYNNQAIVKVNGDFKITKLTEDVKFTYANFIDNYDRDNLFGYYFSETVEPPRLAGQLILVHETINQKKEPRKAWIFTPGVGRVKRAPNVGYDNPSTGTDGEQFNDQVDMFNGALDRYNWKLVGRKEMYVAYNSAEINSPEHKYSDMIRKGHMNPDLMRYELHRVWVVDSNLRKGARHQLKRRVFYLDEDSWSIAAVDGYDNRDQLWKFQEAHLVSVPFVPTTTGSPEVIHDLQSGRYFVTAMSNEDRITNFDINFPDKHFRPAAMKKRIR